MKSLTGLLAALAVAGCGAAVPVAAPEPGPGPAAIPAPAALPASAADPALGRLAYLRDRLLFIFDFATGAERQVTTGGISSNPAWDATGTRLAFLWRAEPGAPAELRIITAAAAVAFPTVPDPIRFGWSPAAPELLAFTQRDLWQIYAEGGAEVLVKGGGAFAWSPDGAQIAYVTMEPQATPPPLDTLWTAARDGGAPVARLKGNGAGIWLQGWWPDGQGLLYWLAGAHSASIGADGVGLTLLPFATGQPKVVSEVVADPTWIAWAPDGKRFATVVGGYRYPFTNKSLAVCSTATLACDSLIQPPGVVSVDTAWSPDGSRLAFVRGADLGGMGRMADWAPTRSLWVSAPDGSGARELASAGKGAFSPRWSRDGRHILFLREGTICLIDPDGSNLVQVPVGTVVSPVAWYQP